MKKGFLFFVLWGLSVFSHAATHLTVELKDGNKYSFSLAKKPIVSLLNGEFVINDNSSTSYAIANMKNFHFSDASSDRVETLKSSDIRIVSVDESTIQIKNAEPSSLVSLTNISGQKLLSKEVDLEGVATINLPKVKGVYVLSVSGKSLKVILK